MKILPFLLICILSICGCSVTKINKDIVCLNPQESLNPMSLLYANDSLDYFQSFSGGFIFLPMPKLIERKYLSEKKLFYIANTIGHNVSFLTMDYNGTKSAIKSYESIARQKIELIKDTITSITISKNVRIDSVRTVIYKQNLKKINYEFLERFIPIENNHIIRTVTFSVFDSIKPNEISTSLLFQEKSSLLNGFNKSFLKGIKSNYDDPFQVGDDLDSGFAGNSRLTLKYLEWLYPDSIKRSRNISQSVTTVKMWNCQFAGDYLSLSKLLSKSSAQFKDSINYEGISTQDAIDYVKQKSQGQDLFLLNDSHNEPISRWFAVQLLDVLYTNGYRYLAVETLNQHLAIGVNKLDNLAGFYSQEATFSLFLQLAIKKGFTLVPYEYVVSCDQSKNADPFFCMNERELGMSKNILKVFTKDTKAKVFVYAGHDHIRKHTNDGWKFMAIDLVESGKKVFSLDQVKLMQKPRKEKTPILYNQFMNTDSPTNKSIIYFKDNKPFLPQSFSNDYNALVAHPIRNLNSVKEEDQTPWFYTESNICNQKLVIYYDKKLINSTLEIFPEDKKEFLNTTTPQFKKIIEKAGSITVYLPKYSFYYIQFIAKNGKIIKKFFYDFNY